MTTLETVKPIDGDQLYQQRARIALPLLVRQAHAHSPIYYSELAKELGMPNPRNLNRVLGSIGISLNELSKKIGNNIPPIQCLVISKITKLPSKGIDWFITNKDDFSKLSRKQQRLIVETELQKIFSYPSWLDVLNALDLKPVALNYLPLLLKAREFKGGGESEHHQKLKSFVSLHPELFSVPRHVKGEIEYSLPSGDSLDVLFRYKYDWIGVEVKSNISDLSDIVRGLFQCVKYRAVIEAYQAVQNLPQSARTVLVLEGMFPNDLISLQHILGVEVLDNIVPR